MRKLRFIACVEKLWNIVTKPQLGTFHYSPFANNDTNSNTSSVSTNGSYDAEHQMKGDVKLDSFNPFYLTFNIDPVTAILIPILIQVMEP